MMIPTFDDILRDLADAGQRMWQIGAAEGAAGNMSVFIRELASYDSRFSAQQVVALPVHAPALANGWLLVTAAGRRVRDISAAPETTLCLLHIHDNAMLATVHAGAETKPTSELNSHLAIHNDHVARRGVEYHAVVHAQPLHLTFLSHIERYGDPTAFNRRLLRWQPETIIEFPEGIDILAFQMPGSLEQTEVTMAAMREHRAVIWRRHGIVTRADSSAGKAADLVEYAETAARYEYLNLQAGEPSAGLSDGDLRIMCERLQIDQRFF